MEKYWCPIETNTFKQKIGRLMYGGVCCKNGGVLWEEGIWTIKISCGDYHGIRLRKYLFSIGNNILR